MSNPVLRIAALVICFGMLFGFGISSIAGVLDELAFQFNLGVSGKETLVSILVVACFAGAVVAAPLSSRLGRRPTMVLAAVLAVLGYAIVLANPGYMLLVTARIILGLSIGLSSMVVPMYAAEATPAPKRGAVVALFQLAITGGILLAYTVALLFHEVWSWSGILGVGIGPAALVCLLTPTLPESPRWLLGQKKPSLAANAATRLGLEHEWLTQPAAEPEPSSSPISSSRAKDTARNAPTDTTRRGQRTTVAAVMALCGGLFVLQNFSGIDGILYYAPHIFQTLGFAAGTASLAATFGLGLVNFLATLVALKLVDSAGRRPLLIGGSALMVVGMAMVIAASIFQWAWVSLFGLSLFILAFAVSLGPLPYVMMSELFPARVREAGIAAASSISWLFNALIAFTFLSVVEAIGLTLTMTFFMVVCALSLVIGLVYLPETRRVPLEAIEENVMRGETLRKLGKMHD